MTTIRVLFLTGLALLSAGCASDFRPRFAECYALPKYEWDRCPFPHGSWLSRSEVRNLPTVKDQARIVEEVRLQSDTSRHRPASPYRP